MSKKEKITKFVEKVFNEYQISTNLIKLVRGDDEESPIFKEREADKRTIEIIANMFGVEPKVIENCDEERIFEVYNNYPFFKYIKEFRACEYYANYDNEEIQTQGMLNAIFGSNYDTNEITPKYIPEKIVGRLKNYLSDMDKLVPGTLHKNADILGLTVYSQDFFSYSKMTRLLNAFFRMLERTEELFFKTLNKNLTKKEVKEYNTFITYLYGRDVAIPTQMMYYNYVCSCRELFKKEGYKTLFSYVSIPSYINFEPWRCPEFAENKELAQKYVDYFPESKEMMTNFNMISKNILCKFTWSDDKRDKQAEEFDDLFGEELNAELDEIFCEIHHVDANLLDKKITQIYLPKTETELSVNKDYCDRLQQFILPPKKGGLIKNVQEWYTSRADRVLFKRMQNRLELRKEGK